MDYRKVNRFNLHTHMTMKNRKLNEELVVYGFVDDDGEEQEFVTLNPAVALERARNCNVNIIERVYEYKYSRGVGEGRKRKRKGDAS